MCHFFTKYSLVYPDFENSFKVVAQVLSTIQTECFSFSLQFFIIFVLMLQTYLSF